MAETKIDVILHELIRRINNNNHQTKLIEQRVQTVERRMETLESTDVSKSKKINDEIESLRTSISELKTSFSGTEKQLEHIDRQINKFATKKDIMTLEQMFKLLSPLFDTKKNMTEDV